MENIKIKKCCKCGREFPATKEYYNSDKNRKDGLYPQCKECRSGRKMFDIEKENIKEGYKKCIKCERELPENEDYYFKKKDSFTSQCKECQGYKFTNKLTKISKDGYKFCIKCDRELPNTNIYFPIDKDCKGGLRNVCRECGKDGHFMKEGYTPAYNWSEEENKIFLDRYPNYTNEELRNLYYPNLTDKQMFDRAYKYGVSKSEETYWRGRQQQAPKVSAKLKGVPKSEEAKRKLSETKKRQFKEGIYISPWLGRIVSDEERKRLSERQKGKWSGENNPRVANPLIGEMNGRWLGGVKDVYRYLRDFIKDWKLESMQHYNFKCAITGCKFDHIHHLVPFRDIVNELFQTIDLKFKQSIGEYSDYEIKIIQYKIIELHKFYGIGIPLNREMHKLFHDTYGYTKTNKEMFDEFKDNYYKGVYDDLLPLNLQSNNSIKRLKELGLVI